MNRAAVLIGVNRAGRLPVLDDAVRSAHAMEKWALKQRMNKNNVRCLTDEKAPLEVGVVKQAICDLVMPGNLDQLIVYFAGHGVNILYGEQWLLSGAPMDPQAAINVEGSVALARRCGIPHVVLISDACRTAAEGIDAQSVRGSEAFPNVPGGGPEQSVDVFFACTLGRPALEVRDPTESTASYRALYTDVLVLALCGEFPEVVQSARIGNDEVGVIRPRPLKRWLPAELARRLTQLQLYTKVSQIPDARITSDEDAWLAQVPWVPRVGVRQTRGGRGGEWTTRHPTAVVHRLLAKLLREPWANVDAELRMFIQNPNPITRELARGVRQVASGFSPTYLESQCGIKVRGARIVDAISNSDAAVPRLANQSGEVVVIERLRGPAASVLLVLDDQCSVVIPAIPGFIAALTLEDGELVDVTYEPSQNSKRWSEHGHKANALGNLRGAVAAAARLGLFRLEPNDGAAFLDRMEDAKGVAPALGLYASYAFHDLQLRHEIRATNELLFKELSMSFFDLALVARAFNGDAGRSEPRYFPFVPMLAQGWALLAANRESLPGSLDDLQRHLAPSLWTKFAPSGTDRLKELVLSEGIR